MELSCIVKGTEAEVTWKFRPELEKKDDKTNDNQKEIIDDDGIVETFFPLKKSLKMSIFS